VRIRTDGAVAGVIALLERLHHVQPLKHAPEDRVGAVQIIVLAGHQEELAVGAVGRAGARHARHARAEQPLRRGLEVGGHEHLGVRLGDDGNRAHDAAQARPAVLDRGEAAVAPAPEGELALQIGQFAAALARALGVAGLGHEVGNDAVEFQPVIEALIGQGADALDMVRRRARLQFHQDASLGCVDHPQVLGRHRAPVTRLAGRLRHRSSGQQGSRRRQRHHRLDLQTRPQSFLTLANTLAATAGLTKLLAEQFQRRAVKTVQMPVQPAHAALLHNEGGQGAVVDQGLMTQVLKPGGTAVDPEFRSDGHTGSGLAALDRRGLARVAVFIVAAGIGQTLDRNDLLVLAGAEDGHALAGAADDADLADRCADHLAAVGDQHEVVRLLDREGGGQTRARAAAQAVGRQPLPAPPGAAILIGRGPLAEAGFRDRQNELLGRAQFGDTLHRQGGVAGLFVVRLDRDGFIFRVGPGQRLAHGVGVLDDAYLLHRIRRAGEDMAVDGRDFRCGRGAVAQEGPVKPGQVRQAHDLGPLRRSGAVQRLADQGLRHPVQHGRVRPNHRLALDEADIPQRAFGNPAAGVSEQGVVESRQPRHAPRPQQAHRGDVLQMRRLAGIDLALQADPVRQVRRRGRDADHHLRRADPVRLTQRQFVGKQADAQPDLIPPSQRLTHLIAQAIFGDSLAEQFDRRTFEAVQVPIQPAHPAPLHAERGQGAVVEQGLAAQILNPGRSAVDPEFRNDGHAGSSLAALVGRRLADVAVFIVAARIGQTLDRNDLLVLAGAEDGHALAGAADDADLSDRSADHLAAVRDQHQIVRLLDREGGGQARARATAQTVRRQPLSAAARAAILIGRGPLAEARFRDRQDELFGRAQFGDALDGQGGVAGLFVISLDRGDVLFRVRASQRLTHGVGVFDIGGALFRRRVHAAQDGHGDDRVAVLQADAPHAGGVAALEHAHVVGLEADGPAQSGRQQHVVLGRAQADADHAVAVFQLHGDLARAVHRGEVAELVASHVARLGGEHDVVIAPSRFVFRQGQHVHDAVARLDRQQVDEGLAARLRIAQRQAPGLQLIGLAVGGEEQHRRVGRGAEDAGDDVLILHRHAAAALAAAMLGPIGVQRHALDVARVGHGHDHVLARDQVFVFHLGVALADEGAAINAELILHQQQVFADDGQDVLAIRQDGQVALDGVGQGARLAEDVVAAQ
uniref:Glutamate synthase large subunit n=1 Tax=Parastrongyloides trichosuri TaxID=131310 RepID=A0A0N5A0B3_PARTI